MMLRLDGMEAWIDGVFPLSVPWLPFYIEEYWRSKLPLVW
jgi:hypothetical protein